MLASCLISCSVALLLPLLCLTVIGFSLVESQSIAALQPFSLPAYALQITVFGRGFNSSRLYTCRVAGPGGVVALCPAVFPQTSASIECLCVLFAPWYCFCSLTYNQLLRMARRRRRSLFARFGFITRPLSRPALPHIARVDHNHPLHFTRCRGCACCCPRPCEIIDA
jgi:hypothetical protein